MDQTYFVTPFASLGDQTAIPIPIDAGGNVSMQQGWGPDYARDQDTDPLAKPIDRANTNYLFFIISQALAAIQRTGIPEWISPSNKNGTPLAYPKYAQVRYSATVPGLTFETYVSTVDNNTSIPGADANWQPIASITASAADVVTGTSGRLTVTPLTLKSYPGNTAQRFGVATASAATDAVPLAQMQAGQGNWMSTITFSTSQTVTVAQLGNLINLNAGVNATLPPITSVPPGTRITFFTTASASVNQIIANGTDVIASGQLNVTSTLTARGGVFTTLVRPFSTGTTWQVEGVASTEFNGLKGLGGQAVGTLVNAAAAIAAASNQFTFTADEVVVATALGGVKYTVSGISLLLNTLNVGANGMNVGAPPNSGVVILYLLYNPATGSKILLAGTEGGAAGPMICALSGIPAGYTASALVGAYITNGSGQFVPFLQTGRRIACQQATGVSVTGAVTLIGFQWTGLPLTAKTVSGYSALTNGTASADTSNIFPTAAGNVGAQGLNKNGFGGVAAVFTDMPVSLRTSYLTLTNPSGSLNYSNGYSSYTI